MHIPTSYVILDDVLTQEAPNEGQNSCHYGTDVHGFKKVLSLTAECRSVRLDITNIHNRVSKKIKNIIIPDY